MKIIFVLLILSAAYGVLRLLASRSGKKLVVADGVRRAARIRIVTHTVNLCELENKIVQLGEGTDPGLREQAATMRARLEADCIRHGLPLGLVRHARPKVRIRHLPIT